MRKTNIILILLLFCSHAAWSYFGIKIGLNLNHMRFNNIQDSSIQNPVTFQIGGFFTWNLNKRFSIQPELYYSQSGVKRKIEIYGQTLILSEDYSYLRLPVVFKLSIVSNDPWNIAPLCGLYGAYNLTAVQKVSHADQEFSDSIQPLIKRFDYGWVAGLEIRHKIWNGSLILDFRFSSGLINTSRREYSADKIFHRMIVVQVGYWFGSHRK